MNDTSGASSTVTSAYQFPLAVFRVLLLMVVLTLLMEMPIFDPMRVNPFYTGPVLTLLWFAGLLAWALRATRSHQSQFGISTMMMMVTFVALGFVNIFVLMAAICGVMIADIGVTRKKTWGACFWRSLQSLAGISGLAHVGRVTYHLYLK